MANIKLIIADCGNANMGKTTSIRKVFDRLYKKYPNTTAILYPKNKKVKRDVEAVIKIGGILVGIMSIGDPGTNLAQRLKNMINRGCDIILVACRTKGDTHDAVVKLGKSGYEIIWVPNGKCVDSQIWDQLTDRYADWIATAIEQSALNGTIII